MDPKTIESICKQVYQRFPEVSGVKPHLQSQAQTSAAAPHTLLIFKGSVTLEDGKKMPRIIRVVVNERGKILKMTTSR